MARPVGRGFPIEDSSRAERAVQEAVEAGGFAAGIGLPVTCVLRLRPDDEAIAHRRKQRSLRYKTDRLDPAHEFRLRQARQQHELEVLRQQQDQELVSAKIDFYRYWPQHGGVGAWALHLAQHPEDTRLVVTSIQKDQLSLIKDELELIARDSPEDFQKAESARALLPAVNHLIEQGASRSGAGSLSGSGGAGSGARAPVRASHDRHAVRSPAGARGPLRALRGRRAGPRGAPGSRLGRGRARSGPRLSAPDAPPEPAVTLGSRAGERLLGELRGEIARVSRYGRAPALRPR
ncbi:hypothetical protein [Streptomyces sp. NBC_00649]|uniref:hypothetical protein n=1 Tax=Streptomyces sp. NBC_00649 TaxID=2975798 RepID=UPI003248C8C7